jgi:hypothetical protein
MADNLDAGTKNILDSTDLTISLDNKKAVLTVIYRPVVLWEPFALVLGGIALLFVIFSDVLKIEEESVVYIPLGVIAWFVVLFISFSKRVITSRFFIHEGKLKMYNGGIYSSKFYSSNKSLSLPDIVGVGIRRYVRKYGDGFEVFVNMKSRDTVEITGNDLSFSDSQFCAETIREFLGIQEKIKAVD